MNVTSEIKPYISPSIETIYGKEIYDRVLASLDLIPQIINSKKGLFVSESRYNFITPLRLIAPEILREPDGITKFEKICENLHGLLGLGRRSYLRYPAGLDHHWGTGIDVDAGEGIPDVYYTDRWLQEAEQYLERAGVIKPPVAP